MNFFDKNIKEQMSYLFDKNVGRPVNALNFQVTLFVDGNVGFVVDVSQMHVPPIGAKLGLVTIRGSDPNIPRLCFDL